MRPVLLDGGNFNIPSGNWFDLDLVTLNETESEQRPESRDGE